MVDHQPWWGGRLNCVYSWWNAFFVGDGGYCTGDSFLNMYEAFSIPSFAAVWGILEV